MQNKDILNELAQSITRLLPANMRGLQSDLESNVRELLQNSLRKMNLVTREEFDIQVAVLERTREKLEALEKALANKK